MIKINILGLSRLAICCVATSGARSTYIFVRLASLLGCALHLIQTQKSYIFRILFGYLPVSLRARHGRCHDTKAKVFIVTFIFVFAWSLFSHAASMQEYFEQGNQSYQEGNYNAAVRYYEKAVELDPNYAPVYNALGLTYGQMKSKLSDVVWFFNVAAEIDPEYAEAFLNLCRTYSDAREYTNAEKACLEALSINPDMGSAQLSLAWVYLFGLSKPSEAIQYFEEVLEKVKMPRLYWGLGMAHVMKGEHAQVLDIITTLRGMGEDQLALQLENSIRPKDTDIPVSAAPVPTQQRGPSVGMPASANVRLTPPSSVPAKVSLGSNPMKVRLRAKLSSTMGTSSEMKEETTYDDDDASSSGELSPAEAQARKEAAIQKIRQIQRIQRSNQRISAPY